MVIGGAGTREEGKCTIMDSCHVLSGEGRLPPVFNRSFGRDVLRRKKMHWHLFFIYLKQTG